MKISLLAVLGLLSGLNAWACELNEFDSYVGVYEVTARNCNYSHQDQQEFCNQVYKVKVGFDSVKSEYFMLETSHGRYRGSNQLLTSIFDEPGVTRVDCTPGDYVKWTEYRPSVYNWVYVRVLQDGKFRIEHRTFDGQNLDAEYRFDLIR